MAQSVRRSPCKRKVSGSIPSAGVFLFFRHLSETSVQAAFLAEVCSRQRQDAAATRFVVNRNKRRAVVPRCVAPRLETRAKANGRTKACGAQDAAKSKDKAAAAQRRSNTNAGAQRSVAMIRRAETTPRTPPPRWVWRRHAERGPASPSQRLAHLHWAAMQASCACAPFASSSLFWPKSQVDEPPRRSDQAPQPNSPSGRHDPRSDTTPAVAKEHPDRHTFHDNPRRRQNAPDTKVTRQNSLLQSHSPDFRRDRIFQPAARTCLPRSIDHENVQKRGIGTLCVAKTRKFSGICAKSRERTETQNRVVLACRLVKTISAPPFGSKSQHVF